MNTKIQIVFYSMYGHIYRMAEAVAAGAREVPGAEVALYQVPEPAPDAGLEQSGAKAARQAFAHVPVATVERLAEADAWLSPTSAHAVHAACGGWCAAHTTAHRCVLHTAGGQLRPLGMRRTAYSTPSPRHMRRSRTSPRARHGAASCRHTR